MGIRGVWSTLRRSFKVVEPLQVQSLRKIGIDMFSLVYTHRAHLDELLALLKSWSDHGHLLTCIWDGNAPKEKQEIIGQRRSARDSAIEKKDDLEMYLANYESQLSDTDIKHLKTAITSLSWQGWHLTGTLKRKIQESLGPNVRHIHAEGEADDLLIEMMSTNNTNEKKIDIIMTLDSDLLAMGAEHIWRLLRIRGSWLIEDISVEAVCNEWRISLGQLQDACFLAGWDRCHLVTKGTYMPFEVALNRMKYYQQMTIILEKFPNEIIINPEAMDRLLVLKKESRARWQEILASRRV